MTGETVEFDISGFGLRFEGMSSALATELKRLWRDYEGPLSSAPALVIRLEDDDRVMTPGRFTEGVLRIDAPADAVGFRGDEGEILDDADPTRAVARLARGDAGRRLWGLVNLTCAAVSSRLQARGGGVVHAAGILVGGRAFLLVGPSGCGKTTWARSAAGAGLPVLSDDCVLVESANGRLMALGSPFRSTDFRAPGPGRWPVAAILIPQPAAEPALAPVSRLLLEARITANLLFSSASRETRPEIPTAAAAIAEGAPARLLSFRPDASWIPLVTTL